MLTIPIRWLFGKDRPLVVQLALLVGITAVPLLVLAGVMLATMVNNERESIRQGLLGNARTLAALVDSEIDTHAAIAAALAQSPALQAGDIAGFWQEARRALEFVPGSWLSVADPEGKMLLHTMFPPGSTLPAHVLPEMIKRAYETGQIQVSDLSTGTASRRLAVFVAMPFYRDGKPQYALMIAVPPQRFLALLEDRYTEGEVVAIVDNQKKFVARIPDHDIRVGTLSAEGWRAAMARNPEGWVENISVEGNAILTGYTPTKYGWTVGVAQLTSKLDEPLRKVLWSTSIAAVGLIALSFALAWRFASLAHRAMAALASAARMVGQEKPVSMPDVSFSEARVIAEALAEASIELQRRGVELAEVNRNLENRVAERTRELQNEMRQRAEAEATLRQTQKMEAIGQLTGGIAHDFNNMLTIVLGNLETVQRRLKTFDSAQAAKLQKPIEAALHGGRGAAKLTHRLLAFARAQPLAPTPVDIRQLVSGMSDMLDRTVGETIKVETVSGAGLWLTRVDANQLESALLNLVVNARDAMPEGGRITIETSNAYLDEQYANSAGDVKPGQYVMLCVSDTGAGIPPDKMAKVFEPFFTTKESGKGTGLGLAMVHGFVKQSGGHVRIYSEVGQGTAVKIYLPRLTGAAVPDLVEGRERMSSPARSGETILLVEDDAGVREYAADILMELGYRIIAAASGEEALERAQEAGRIDLLFTDVVLGGKLNGRLLADRIEALRPGIAVLFTTGYTRNAIVHNGQLDPGVHLLSKPYTSEALAAMLRSLLDARR